MTDRRRSKPALYSGSLTAAVALLAGMGVASAQAPAPAAAPLSGAGSFPQSFIVPGTNTSLHVGGQIQIDADYSFNGFSSSSTGAFDNLSPATTNIEGPGAAANPAHSSEGVFRFTGDNSKLFTETRTPTAYGELKTYIEFDFNGGVTTNTTTTGGSSAFKIGDDGVPRLRQAYGTLGPWLFGKAISNFADLAALADTLDGPVEAGQFMGAGTFRQTQIRYTYLLPNGLSVAASIESAFSAGEISTTPTGGGLSRFNNFNAPGISQRVPAFTVKALLQQPWGHTQFGVAVMQEKFTNNSVAGFPGAGAAAIVPGGYHLARWGYMLENSGHFNTFGRDRATWALGYGQGAAQYSWPLASPDLGLNWEEGLICTATGGAGTATSFACSQPRVWGINVGYDHFWTSEWRSGIAFGYDQETKPNAASLWSDAALATLEHRHWSAGASLFWTPVADVQFGATYIWYHREVWSGARGNASRLETQALFRF